MNTIIIASIYDRIKALTKEHGLTQIELCNTCNINIQSHKNRITRNVAPDAIELYNIAQALDTTVEYLVSGVAPEYQKDREILQKIRAALSD